MAFALSHRSLVNLQGVHPDLQKLVVRTLQISPLDFGVIDGLRTEEEEAHCVATGKSETMHSRHLTGHAIDFIAIVNGKGTWEPGPYQTIADAFLRAAVELAICIEWGGCWDRKLNGYTSAAAAFSDYRARRTAAGKSVFTDLGHIQLDATAYP